MQGFRRVAPPSVSRLFLATALFSASAFGCLPSALAQQAAAPQQLPFPESYGPYDAVSLAGGAGLVKPIPAQDPILRNSAAWTISAWVRVSADALTSNEPTLIGGVGDPAEEYARMLGFEAGKPLVWMGEGATLVGSGELTPGTWHLLTATFDGTMTRLYSDGALAGSSFLAFGDVNATMEIAPARHLPGDLNTPRPAKTWKHFGGAVAALTLDRQAMSAADVQRLYENRPDFTLLRFEDASKPWPVQTREQAGYRAPQDGNQLPHSNAPYAKPIAAPLPPAHATLTRLGEADTWKVDSRWMLEAAPKVQVSGAEAGEKIAQPGFNDRGWMVATVPGTVLTTMIDRGVYPDPDYGLNNMAIPESLNRQQYWYRTEFTAPTAAEHGADRNWTLTFNGINYAAEVWLNGHKLGTIKGAFIRGAFDVTGILKPGAKNALSVRISPPPHPGIPQEQSIKDGPGENGGMMCLDGPTFVATEGWDWIPAIRDRDSGIWQDVELSATGRVSIGDAEVVTTLPNLPDTSRADVEIDVPLTNSTQATLKGMLTASFDDVVVHEDVSVPPGGATEKLTPARFPQLTVEHPRLWWPNGYGKPELHTLSLSFVAAGAKGGHLSDSKQLRFGIREVSYELSLLDNTGHLRRVLYSPSRDRSGPVSPVDVTHDGMRQIADGWVSSISKGEDSSPAYRPSTDQGAAPYLTIVVNGVRIAARGGNWGMDDSRKRVSREHLEPYFRLHRDAHLNIIRNWVGQNTEKTFYDLADEYGLMVWNDFWDSTQNYNAEPEDPQLFLRNARDTILRFRNHPSIVMWCGRNEGVPQPILNQGLDELTHTLDGTRYYSPSSNQVNLQNSGPYKFRDPEDYFNKTNAGFSVEVGTPSMPTLQSFESFIPKADQWPVSDDWAYHDWHQKGNGDVAPFMTEIAKEFGAPTSLADFERKAQMLNYVDHRAIFEGMNAHLWAPNSGRMLWMTQPAWPSTMWQILSSDYDTQASFYGVEEACEPIHIQFDPTTDTVQVVDTTGSAPTGPIAISARVVSATNQELLAKTGTLTLAADREQDAFTLPIEALHKKQLIFLKLEAHDSAGRLLSQNLYWMGPEAAPYRTLSALPQATVTASAQAKPADHGERVLSVELRNTGSVAALQAKLTLESSQSGLRILPAYYSDNYVSLLPGESRTIEIRFPVGASGAASPRLSLAGFNLSPATVSIAH
ncbi:glycosyl hydrolase 2 galactose-binding domain-containing protein [Acidipila rosea]|uniref:Glycosyl hydrolase family 2 n=1 Tax=Acidipila rosea TaxID=768535 RepID=A0A4R1L6C7_9BACT|nr:LamG-like jellyroll fold domain-containing protein [Acidipila rosea]TCK73726.1 glycosyl hydrolase family 2 [Acidipila rosea]